MRLAAITLLAATLAVSPAARAQSDTSARAPKPVSELVVLVPDAIGQARWGRVPLTRAVRRELAAGVGKVLGEEALIVEGRAPVDAMDLPALLEQAKRQGADYVLRINLVTKGWLYLARAQLLEVSSGRPEMSFEVGYYKVDAEAPDRGERIGKKALAKLGTLHSGAPLASPPAERPPVAEVRPGAVPTATVAVAAREAEAPLEARPADAFDAAFDTAFEAGLGARSEVAVEGDGFFAISPEWSHTGRIEARHQGFLGDSPLLSGKERQLFTLGVRATIDGSLSRKLRVHVLPLIMVDVVNQRLFRTILEEGFLEASFERVELRVGWDALTWGSASTVNVIDIINSRDFTEGLLDSSKVGQPMIALRLLLGEHSLRLYYFSPFVEPVIPRVDSAFFPLPIALDGPGPLAGSSRVEARTVYGAELEEWAPELAARLSLVLGSVDLSLAYFYGYNRFPLVDPRTIELFYPLIHQVSVDGQWLADPWLVKWEVASVWHQPTDVSRREGVLLPGPRLTWVAGIERTFEGVLGGTTITPVLEVIGDSDSTWFTDHRPPDDFSRIFQNHLTVALRWSLENRVSSEITISDILDLTNASDHILTVEYSERWFQHFTFSIGGRFVHAHAESKIIALEQLTGITTKLRLNY